MYTNLQLKDKILKGQVPVVNANKGENIHYIIFQGLNTWMKFMLIIFLSLHPDDFKLWILLDQYTVGTRPPYFHCRHRIFVGDPQIFIRDPILRWRPPYFHWRPCIFAGDPQIFIRDPVFRWRSQLLIGNPLILIGDPQIFIGDHGFSLGMKIWGLHWNYGVSNENMGVSNEKKIQFKFKNKCLKRSNMSPKGSFSYSTVFLFPL